MTNQIKKTLEGIAGATVLAVALPSFAILGSAFLSRLNPSYKIERLEEVYFKKGQESGSRILLWRDPFIWDETGNKIVGYRNTNAINTPSAGKVDDRDLEVISDVSLDSKYYAEIHKNGYGKITRVKLHLKPKQNIPDYNSSRDGTIYEFLDKQ